MYYIVNSLITENFYENKHLKKFNTSKLFDFSAKFPTYRIISKKL